MRVAYGSRLTSSCSIDAHTTFSGPFTVRGSGALRMGRYCAVGDELCVITTNHEMHHVTTASARPRSFELDSGTPASAEVAAISRTARPSTSAGDLRLGSGRAA